MQNSSQQSPEKSKDPFPIFQTPTKPQWIDLSSNNPFIQNNIFTPPPKIQQTQSNYCHTSPFQVQQSPWKTPRSQLKQQHHEANTPISPFSDRYIPFRPNPISKNLFQDKDFKPIRQFDQQEDQENENKKTYSQILQKKMFDQENILNFKPKQSHHHTSFQDTLKVHSTPLKRKIDSAPFKVLDAPGLEDDYYQDILHWGKNNIIAVGLQRAIFLFSFSDNRVFKAIEEEEQTFTSVQWNSNGQLLGLGTFEGNLQFYDYTKQTIFRKFPLGQKRIGTINWANSNVFACGSKDKSISICDLRHPNLLVERLSNGHTQEICGVSFSENENQLASGGNDNRVVVWDMRSMQAQWVIREHKAAVRAIAWNPQQSGVLASGGGNSDKTIKIFSTLTNSQLNSINVDSQVCKLKFSRTTNELVSSHGYEHNLINIWDNQNMKRVGQLEGHQNRVLYLSQSPGNDLNKILLSGAGDETLKFWNVFPGVESQKKCQLLNLVDLR